MANPWFRMYAEFATDPKVQMLPEKEQRRLVMLFCLRCNGNETLQDEQVAFQLRISNEEWAASKAIFISKSFIDSDNEVLNWDKRQFVSDSSTERVAKYREKKKQECNVSVTPPDTEQIQIQIHKKQTPSRTSALDDSFEEFWNAYPKKVGKDKALLAWKKKKPPIQRILQALEWQVPSEQWTKQSGVFIPNPTTYINEGRWQDQPMAEVTF